MNLGRGLRRIAYVLIAAVWVLFLALSIPDGWAPTRDILVWLLKFTAVCGVLIGVITWIARGFRAAPQSRASSMAERAAGPGK
jgi:hypothetical protein